MPAPIMCSVQCYKSDAVTTTRHNSLEAGTRSVRSGARGAQIKLPAKWILVGACAIFRDREATGADGVYARRAFRQHRLSLTRSWRKSCSYKAKTLRLVY